MKTLGNDRLITRAILAGAALCHLTAVEAADGTWTATATTGNWNDTITAPWSGGIVADGAGSTANFTSDITAATTVTLDSNRTIGSLVFDDAGATGDSAWTLTGNTLTTSGTITTTAAATIASNLSGGFTKGGGANLFLTGSNAGLTGPVAVTAGDLRVATAVNSLSAAASVTINGGRLLFGSSVLPADAINYSVKSLTTGRDVFVQNGSTLSIADGLLNFGATNFYIQSTTTPKGLITSGTNTLTVTAATVAATDQRIQLAIKDNGAAVALVKEGAGQVILDAANTYTGGTIVNAGTLKVLSATAAGAKTGLGTSSVSVNAAKLDFSTGSTANAQSHGNNLNLAGATLVSNDGVVTYSGAIGLSGANTVEVVWPGKDATFSNTVSGAGSLAKTGTGTLILSGANTYTGASMIQAGTCIVGAAGSSTSPAWTVETGGTLRLLADTAAPIANLPATATVALAGGSFDYRGNTETIASLTSNGGTLLLNSASALTTGTLDLTSGETTVSIEAYGGGVATVMNVTTVNGPLTNLKSSLRDAVFSHSAGVLSVASTPGTLNWTGGFTDNWDFATENWSNGVDPEDLFFNGDLVSFTDTPAFKNVIIPAAVSPGGVTVTNSSAPENNYNFSGAGAIAGNGGFTKNGTGLVVVANKNTYTGATVINGGTLQLTVGDDRIGDSSQITINAGATLDIAATNAISRDVLTNAAIIVNGGTLTQSAGVHAHIGNITLQNGAVWTATSTGNFAGVNADLDGNVTVAGTSPSTVGPFTSGIRFDLRSPVFTVADVTASATVDLNVSASLRGTLGFSKAGPGTMFLSGDSNDYAGTTAVSAGMLLLEDLLALPNDLTKVTVAAGAGFGGTVGPANLTEADVAALAAGVVWDAGGDARFVLDTNGQTVTLNSNIVGNFKILAIGGGTLNLTGTVTVNDVLTDGVTTVNVGGGAATTIAITSNTVSAGTTLGTKKVTLAFTANGAVDIYASDNLQSWGAPIATGVTASPFVQDNVTATKRFYVIVSAGQSYP